MGSEDKAFDRHRVRDRIFDRLDRLLSPEGFAKGLDVQLRGDDVLLCAGPKCGTTWVQQILHGLRSGASMEYEDINTVVPALELAALGGPAVEDCRNDSPRMFKTHVAYEMCPPAGKMIVLTRNPNDAALSYYYYFCNWIFEDGDITLDEFVEWFYVHETQPGATGLNAVQMQHLVSWYPHRNDENVLWLHYEDLKANLPLCIRMISDFIGIGVGDQKLLDLVHRQASLEFMKQHASKFNSHGFKLARNEAAGLPRLAGLHRNAGKVRSGRVNESKETFSPEALKKLDQKWIDIVKLATGFDCYEDMRHSINEELRRKI